MNRAEKWRRIQKERRRDIFIGNSKPKSAHEQGVIKYRFFFVKWIHVFMSMSFITIRRHTGAPILMPMENSSRTNVKHTQTHTHTNFSEGI